MHELILTEDPRFLAVIVSAFVDEQLDQMCRREIVGRLYYECYFFPCALKERLKAEAALYGPDHPQLLTKVAGLCVDATRRVLNKAQSSPTVDPDYQEF